MGPDDTPYWGKKKDNYQIPIAKPHYLPYMDKISKLKFKV